MDHDEMREHRPDVVADADLVVRTRSGDTDAFGELWRRHYRAGVTVARNMTSSLDADDLVQEAYTRIYHSIVTGGGPTGSFRAYLFTSIRNTAAAWGRSRRETTYDELESVEDPAATDHESEAALDRSLTHQAFRSLPTRWQEVLWYSEIERMKPAEIAPLLGMKATAVAQLTFRAREGLRAAWIQAHLRLVVDGSDCQWTIERLGAYTRRNLGRRDNGKLERHLAACVRCSIVAGEAREVSSRLALVLLPLAVGATGAAGYLATVQSGGAPLVALAGMPSSVVHGAVTVAPGGVVGAGSGAGAGAAGAAGAGAAGATAASAVTAGAATVGTAATAAGAGSALAGIGAVSGLAAASLAVVTGVVAAAVTPPAPGTAPPPAMMVVTDAPDTSAPTPSGIDEGTSPLLPDEGPRPTDVPVAPGSAGTLDVDAGTIAAGGTDAAAGGSEPAGPGAGGDAASAERGGPPAGGGDDRVAGDGSRATTPPARATSAPATARATAGTAARAAMVPPRAKAPPQATARPPEEAPPEQAPWRMQPPRAPKAPVREGAGASAATAIPPATAVPAGTGASTATGTRTAAGAVSAAQRNPPTRAAAGTATAAATESAMATPMTMPPQARRREWVAATPARPRKRNLCRPSLSPTDGAATDAEV